MHSRSIVWRDGVEPPDTLRQARLQRATLPLRVNATYRVPITGIEPVTSRLRNVRSTS